MENQEEKDAIQEQFRLLNKRINNLFNFTFLATCLVIMVITFGRANFISIWMWILIGLAWAGFIVIGLTNGLEDVKSTQASQKKKDNNEN